MSRQIGLRILYACMGGFLTLLFMWLGCKVFSHIVNFSIPEQLSNGNMAAGQVIMGMFIGIGTAMGLDPDARSPAVARGVMQILPTTYREIKAKNPFLANIEEPRWNIAAGIFYDRQLYRKWKKKHDIRTGERLNFAFASYNAGYGNVFKAYRRASAKHGDVREWQRVAPYAPNETRYYVKRIQELMAAVN